MGFLIIYVFAILLTQAVTEHAVENGNDLDEVTKAYYGTLSRSICTLFMAVSEGKSWGQMVFGPLSQIGHVWVALFLIYIAFVYFAVLNVVTGVFCQNALESAQQDLDMVLHSQLKAKNSYVERLQILFSSMDTDKSGELSPKELAEHLKDERVQSFFRAMDVDTDNIWRLWNLMDQDDSDILTFEEFVDGCLRLRGSATRIDVESLSRELKLVQKTLQAMA